MRQLFADLWQSEATYPFGPDVRTRAYLWRRADGNVLFYNTALPDELDAIEDLGGVTWQYLSHRDEVSPSLATIRQRFGARLCCHSLEAAAVARVQAPDVCFDAPHSPLPDLYVLPTPGHTPGSSCFRVQGADGLRYLFTGDTLFPDGAGWGTYVAATARAKLRESLELLRSPVPDVVLSSAARDADGYRRLREDDWQRILDGAIADLRP
jgi:glyoxylase-like metal-dependent hydrolase (beta-lactamase superfamily II)